jgi:hypothetical protein
MHYGRMKIPRVPNIRHSGGRNSSPSVALGEELHSEKRGLPECRRVHDTRGREALGKALFHECNTRGKETLADEKWWKI